DVVHEGVLAYRLPGRGDLPAQGLAELQALRRHDGQRARGRADAHELAVLHDPEAGLAIEHLGGGAGDRLEEGTRIEIAGETLGDVEQRGEPLTERAEELDLVSVLASRAGPARALQRDGRVGGEQIEKRVLVGRQPLRAG